MARVCGRECKSNCILKIFLKELSCFCFFELILFKKNNGNYSNERRAPQLFESWKRRRTRPGPLVELEHKRSKWIQRFSENKKPMGSPLSLSLSIWQKTAIKKKETSEFWSVSLTALGNAQEALSPIVTLSHALYIPRNTDIYPLPTDPNIFYYFI